MSKLIYILAAVLMGIPIMGFLLVGIVWLLTNGDTVGIIYGCGVISVLIGLSLLIYVTFVKKDETAAAE